MTSRELVLRTLAFSNTTERVPRQLWSLPWAAERYPDMMQRMNRDFPADMVGAPVHQYEPSPVEKGDLYAVGLYTDPWGCEFENIQAGVIGEVKHPIVPAEDEDWSDLSRMRSIGFARRAIGLLPAAAVRVRSSRCSLFAAVRTC